MKNKKRIDLKSNKSLREMYIHQKHQSHGIIRDKIPNNASFTKKQRLSSSNSELTNTSDNSIIHQNNTNITSNENSSRFRCPLPETRYSDLGGIDEIIALARELIEWPLVHRELYDELGVQPPCGVLLHGPPGCGKTLLAHAIAGETSVSFFEVSGPEIIAGISGESESRIRELFTDALRIAPSIIFIDEIDAITQRRESTQKDMERRIVAQLAASMDSLRQVRATDKNINKSCDNVKNLDSVIVIGATNRPDALDPSLRRAGRFDREILMTLPTSEVAREKILRVLSRNLKLESNTTGFDLSLLARKTSGFVGADLAALTREAATLAIHRILHQLNSNIDHIDKKDIQDRIDSLSSQLPNFHIQNNCLNTHSDIITNTVQARLSRSHELSLHRSPFTSSQLSSLFITMNDFLDAIDKVQPSSKREGFTTIPDVRWNDIGALDSIKEELEWSIVRPIIQPELFTSVGLNLPTGVLLFGPPGCGKTIVAKAVANKSNASFISVKGPELMSKWVGESERAIRTLFARARASVPCIVFFDEIDALCPRRGSGADVATQAVTTRVVNQLLTEMDGLESRNDVFVIAATNRPDILDPAMLRPGRLDKLLYVSIPSEYDRIEILKKHISKFLQNNTKGYSGADLAALVREASLIAIRNAQKYLLTHGQNDSVIITKEHYIQALKKIKPSVSTDNNQQYENIQNNLHNTFGS